MVKRLLSGLQLFEGGARRDTSGGPFLAGLQAPNILGRLVLARAEALR